MAEAHSLADFLEVARGRIESSLEAFLPAPPACPALLSAAMRYSLMAGGKRLRPILLLAAADAVGRKTGTDPFDLGLPAACAVEFIHTYSLIHDDLPSMDNDTLRRGRPTLHVVYGDGVAILAGDGLQAEAFAILARASASDDPALAMRALAATEVIAVAAGASGMVGGQTIDLQAAGLVSGHRLKLDGDGLRAMHLRKTGALIRASAVAGAILAGGTCDEREAVSQWAAEVGLAFQIVDDILDVEGSDTQLGKTPGKDAAFDKPTYPALFGIDRARVMARECREKAHAVLEQSGLIGGWLDPIAEWVITRRN